MERVHQVEELRCALVLVDRPRAGRRRIPRAERGDRRAQSRRSGAHGGERVLTPSHARSRPRASAGTCRSAAVRRRRARSRNACAFGPFRPGARRQPWREVDSVGGAARGLSGTRWRSPRTSRDSYAAPRRRSARRRARRRRPSSRPARADATPAGRRAVAVQRERASPPSRNRVACSAPRRCSRPPRPASGRPPLARAAAYASAALRSAGVRRPHGRSDAGGPVTPSSRPLPVDRGAQPAVGRSGPRGSAAPRLQVLDAAASRGRRGGGRRRRPRRSERLRVVAHVVERDRARRRDRSAPVR